MALFRAINYGSIIYVLKVKILNLQGKMYWSINCAGASVYLVKERN